MVDNKVKILIVEDDLTIVKAIMTKFKIKGISVDFAIDGEEALNKFENKNYEVLLLDLLLPKQNGFWLLEKIQENKNLKYPKVIIFSNLSREEEVLKAKKYVIADYVVKSESNVEDVVQKTVNLLKK